MHSQCTPTAFCFNSFYFTPPQPIQLSPNLVTILHSSDNSLGWWRLNMLLQKVRGSHRVQLSEPSSQQRLVKIGILPVLFCKESTAIISANNVSQLHYSSPSCVISELHLMLACVPVMQQSSRNKEEVVLVAALTIVPSTVAANLGLAS